MNHKIYMIFMMFFETGHGFKKSDYLHASDCIIINFI
jgi:hypothetical protein